MLIDWSQQAHAKFPVIDLDCADCDLLTQIGITHVVDMANMLQSDSVPPGAGSAAIALSISDCLPADAFLYSLKPTDLPYITGKLVVKIQDEATADIVPLLKPINQYIDAAISNGGRVLVHCFEGKSRSATVVIQYLMRFRGMNLKDAYNLTQKGRHIDLRLNPRFSRVLMHLERELLPDDAPSVQLKVKEKPQLSSRLRNTSKQQAAKS